MYRLFIEYNNNLEEIVGINDGGLIITSNDPLDFTFGKAYKTYTINIPNISDNNKLLDNLFNKNSKKTLVYDTYLILDDFLQFKGKLYVYGHNMKYADTQFITSTGVLWEELGNKSLKYDFDWSELNHILNQSTITSSFLGRLRYDFISRGNGLYVNDGMDWSPSGVMKNQDICERQPAVQVKYIIEKIFSQYEVYNEFMGETAYNNLFLLYTQNQNRNSDGWLDSSKASGLRTNDFVVSRTLQQDTSLPQFRVATFISDLFNEVENLEFSGIRYRVPEKGAYRFWGKVSADVDFNSGGFSGIWKGRKYTLTIDEYDGGTYIRTLEKIEFNRTDAVPDSFGKIYDVGMLFTLDSKIVELEAGRFIYFNISYRNFATDSGGDLIFPPPTQTMLFRIWNGAFLRVEPFNGIGFGGEVTGEWVIPDIKVSEFVSMFLKHFNIEMYSTNIDVRRLYFTNRYKQIPKSYDITEYILSDSLQIEENTLPVNYDIILKEDTKDKYAERLNTLGSSDGSVSVDLGSRRTEVIESDISKNYIRTTEPTIIQMWNDFNEPTYSTDFNYRFAFFNGTLPFQFRRHAAGNTLVTQNPTATLTTGINNFTNDYYGDHLIYDEGLYEGNFKGNIDRLIEGGLLTCDMKVDTIFLNDIYYLLGRDLRANYAIRIPGFEGYYQIISLNKRGKDIYNCKLFRVIDYVDIDFEPPVPPCNDFNNDFNDDFGCGLIQPTMLYYNNINTSIGNVVSESPTSDVYLFIYSVTPPLPSGLTLNSFTGIISGTPTESVNNQTYTITGSNYDGSIDTNITINIEGLLIPNLTGETISDQSTYLSWDNFPSNFDSIRLERGVDGVNYTEIQSLTYPTSGYTDTGLTYDENYYYRTRYELNSVFSDYSNVIELKTNTCNITLTGVVNTGTTIEIAIDYGCFSVFNDVDVYRDSTYLKTIPVNSTGFTDSVPDSGVSNTYYIEMEHNGSKVITSNTAYVNTSNFQLLVQGEVNNDVGIEIFGGAYDFTIDWGDGTIEHFSGSTTSTIIYHRYPQQLQYLVQIEGLHYAIFSKDNIEVNSVIQWGSYGIKNIRFIGQTDFGFAATDKPTFLPNSSMENMFAGCFNFNEPLNDWDVSNVTNMNQTFQSCYAFNQPLFDWNVSNVTTMRSMFNQSLSFNGVISGWNVENVMNMSFMFQGANNFNRSLNSWNVSNVTTMRGMFSSASLFNQPLDMWNVSNVTDMRNMFVSTSFDQFIGNWNVSNVTRMDGMFQASPFNRALNNWNVSNVTGMGAMFFNCSNFNQPLNDWNVSNVTSMNSMFDGATSFNQALSNWNTSNVWSMSSMFRNTSSFNQNLTSWCVTNIPSEPTSFSTGSFLSEMNKPIWGTCP